MRKTFKFKLYTTKKNKKLHNLIDIAYEIYNYCISLHRGYYRLTGKHLSKYQLQKHLARVKKRAKYSHWNKLGSQAIQDITDRIELAYQHYFDLIKAGKKASPPGFRKRIKYKSFTLKQAGYKLLEGNKVRIGNTDYKYYKSREIEGQIKTVTVKRDALGDIYIYFSCEVPEELQAKKTTSDKIVGFDFGLKTFLTGSDGLIIRAPEPFKKGAKKVKKASKGFSSKVKGSAHRHEARLVLARAYRDQTNIRDDFQCKLAQYLAQTYDIICLETLNMKGMQRLWGKKINDLGFSNFLRHLEYQCHKTGAKIIYIDRFYPSSKECHNCFFIKQDLTLKEREWLCPDCNTLHDRDKNAAINIARVGASTLGLGDVRPTKLAITA
jgi:putative transposase